MIFYEQLFHWLPAPSPPFYFHNYIIYFKNYISYKVCHHFIFQIFPLFNCLLPYFPYLFTIQLIFLQYFPNPITIFFHVFPIISLFSAAFSISFLYILLYFPYHFTIQPSFLLYFPNHFAIQLIFIPYCPYFFTIQLTFLLYFPHLFTIQLTFLSYFPYHFTFKLTFLPYFPYLYYSTKFSSIFSISCHNSTYFSSDFP